MRIQSGDTTKRIYFVAVDSADYVTRKASLSTFTVYRSRDGGAAALMTPTIAELGANMPGVYSLLLDEDMTIGAGHDTEEMCYHITHAGMHPVTRTIELYRPKITAGNTLGVAADGDVSGNVDGNVGSISGVTFPTNFSDLSIAATTGIVKSNLNAILDTVLSESNPIADGFTYFFDVASPSKTMNDCGVAGSGISAQDVRDAMKLAPTAGAAAAGSIDEFLTNIETDTNELQTDNVPGLIAALPDSSAVQSAAAAALAAYDPPTKDELDTAVSGLATAGNLFLVASEVTSISAVTTKLNSAMEADGSSGWQFTTLALENGPSGSGASAGDIANAVWQETLADHSGGAGSTAEALANASSAGDPWATAIPGSYTSGQAGNILGNLNDLDSTAVQAAAAAAIAACVQVDTAYNWTTANGVLSTTIVSP